MKYSKRILPQSPKSDVIVACFGIIFFLAFAIFSAVTYGKGVVNYNDSDLIKGEYTFVENKTVGYKNVSVEITVEEIDEPIEVSSKYKSAINRNALAAIMPGDKVHLIISGNEIVEMVHGDTYVLKLSERNAVGKRDNLVGIIGCSLFSIACAVFLLVRLLKYRRDKIKVLEYIERVEKSTHRKRGKK